MHTPNIVMVYYDPITKNRPEGKVKILKSMSTKDFYNVEFVDGEDAGFQTIRKILFDKGDK